MFRSLRLQEQEFPQFPSLTPTRSPQHTLKSLPTSARLLEDLEGREDHQTLYQPHNHT